MYTSIGQTEYSLLFGDDMTIVLCVTYWTISDFVSRVRMQTKRYYHLLNSCCFIDNKIFTY